MSHVPFVRRRADIPHIEHVVTPSGGYELGEVRDFRGDNALQQFLPPVLSISWVRLDKDQILHNHVHPVDSMVIVCEGVVHLSGDHEAALNAGDAVCIPANAVHGFRGGGDTGFRGLSIQFGDRGIYTDPVEALVRFTDKGCSEGWEALCLAVEIHAKQFGAHPVFDLLRNSSPSGSTIQERFLASFSKWSDVFQKTLLLRSAIASAEPFRSVFRRHLAEEYDHDLDLRTALSSDTQVIDKTDSMLVGVFSWFQWKMLECDDFGRWLLFFAAIEPSADVFYSQLKDVDFGRAQSHFTTHLAADKSHSMFGLKEIEATGLQPAAYHLAIVEEGWTMIGALYDRLVHIAQQ